MKISILIPCHNEEKTIKECIESCLFQARKFDEIIVVDDGSTDNTSKILKSFEKQIQVVRIPKKTGNKSYAQQRGLKYVTGDILVMTDADTILHCSFARRISLDFKDEKVIAVAGYVKSLKHNWLTACRELDYVIGQDIYKTAQSHIDAVYVMPGCASAFRTEYFKKYITFDHDTLTEDLDFTYKLHETGSKILYDPKAIVYTQDPATISSYMTQMKRWYSGGWQNLTKHRGVIFKRPGNALEMSLMFIEGSVFSALMFIVPIINFSFFAYFMLLYLPILFVFSVYGTVKRKRLDLLIYFPAYFILLFLDAYLFIRTFFDEIVFKNKNRKWTIPERRDILCNTEEDFH
jgi:cellulose synthase/poly-beta-1,6-N-acetylglucosamine synthase-like glycosyltransferase